MVSSGVANDCWSYRPTHPHLRVSASAETLQFASFEINLYEHAHVGVSLCLGAFSECDLPTPVASFETCHNTTVAGGVLVWGKDGST